MTPHPRQHLIDAARTARSRREAFELGREAYELEAARMKWLTNTPKEEALDLRARLEQPVFVGPPQGSHAYTADRLELMGMVGLYRPDPVDGEGPGRIGEDGE